MFFTHHIKDPLSSCQLWEAGCAHHGPRPCMPRPLQPCRPWAARPRSRCFGHGIPSTVVLLPLDLSHCRPGLLHLNPSAGSSHHHSNLATVSYLPGSLLRGQQDPSPSSRQLPFPAGGPASDGRVPDVRALPSEGSFRNIHVRQHSNRGALYQLKS